MSGNWKIYSTLYPTKSPSVFTMALVELFKRTAAAVFLVTAGLLVREGAHYVLGCGFGGGPFVSREIYGLPYEVDF